MFLLTPAKPYRKMTFTCLAYVQGSTVDPDADTNGNFLILVRGDVTQVDLAKADLYCGVRNPSIFMDYPFPALLILN